jgi:hypothetical protein
MRYLMRPSSFSDAFVLSLLATLVAGCTTTEYTLYLQDVDITGPIRQPPVHITSEAVQKPLRITPHISFNPSNERTLDGQINGHSMVDGNGTFRVDTTFNTADQTVTFNERSSANNQPFIGKNLHWITPSASFGVDVDYTLSPHAAFSFGADYSTADGEGLWGYSVGLGLFSEEENSAIRFDVGLQWQTLLYDATTVVVTTTSSSPTNGEVGFFHDRGKSSPMEFYGSFTFNTKREEWPVNILMQVGLSKQSLAKFQPTVRQTLLLGPYTPHAIVHDQRAEFSSTVVVLTPGVYLDLNPTVRLLLGLRINLQTEIKNISPGSLVLPFFQFDWTL